MSELRLFEKSNALLRHGQTVVQTLAIGGLICRSALLGDGGVLVKRDLIDHSLSIPKSDW